MNDTSDDNDVARLFRENDDVGADSSLWLRPLRQFFEEGKPPGDIVALRISPSQGPKLLLGTLTQTGKDRLIFWPVLPSTANMICEGEAVDVVDHITLELPSEKIHVTAYDATGAPVHAARAWRAQHLLSCPLAVCFTLFVRVSVLHEQDVAVQRRVHMPVADKERRLTEVRRYLENFRFWDIPLPPTDVLGGYVYLRVYLDLAPSAPLAEHVSPSMLPADPSMDAFVEGWPEGSAFQIMPSRRTFGQRALWVAIACPPGRLRPDVNIGMPKSTP